MEGESKIPVHDEAEYVDILSRNSRITEILAIVFNQSTTEKEIESMLLDFWNIYDNISRQENSEEDYPELDELEDDDLDLDDLEDDDLELDDLEDDDLEDDSQEKAFLVFDVLCMYMLECVFKRNEPTLSAVSRSLYCYLKSLNISDENKEDILNGTENDFVNTLREFTNFSSAEGEDTLTDALMKCLLDGDFGLSLFLLKFGLVEIPTEANEKSRKIVEKLVNKFNDIFHYKFANGAEEDLRPSMELTAMLDLMRQNDINLRRSLMTFFVIILIFEFQLQEKTESNYLLEMIKDRFDAKFLCLSKFFDEIPETKINFKDIETFILKFLNPLLGVDFGNSLVTFSRDKLCEYWSISNLRSLQNLTRSTIRKHLQNSMMFPEQVNQFRIPLKLKNFLLFHCEDIFDMLKLSHFSSYVDDSIRFLLDEDLYMDLEN